MGDVTNLRRDLEPVGPCPLTFCDGQLVHDELVKADVCDECGYSEEPGQ